MSILDQDDRDDITQIVSTLLAAAVIQSVADKSDTELSDDEHDALAVIMQNAVQTTGTVYWADIHLTRDQAHTRDEYTITWFRNGVRQGGGIADAVLTVVAREDGTERIPQAALAEIGATGSLKYDATGEERLAAGEAALAIAAATIDGQTRTFSKLLSRDSA